MRATTKGISSVRSALALQLASARMAGSATRFPSQLRSSDSSTSPDGNRQLAHPEPGLLKRGSE